MRRGVLSAQHGPWLLTPAAARRRQQQRRQHQPRALVRPLGALALEGQPLRAPCRRALQVASFPYGVVASPWAPPRLHLPRGAPCRQKATQALALGHARRAVHGMRQRGLDGPGVLGERGRGRRTMRQMQAERPQQQMQARQGGMPSRQQCHKLGEFCVWFRPVFLWIA